MPNGESALIISAIVQAGATIVLVGVTIYYAVQTKRTVDAMDHGSKNEFLPIIIPGHYPTLSKENSVRIELKNEGKGLAKRPFKVTFPGVAPIYVNSLPPKDKQDITINYDIGYVLSLETRDRKMVIEYQDVFGRTIKTEATLIENSNLGPNGDAQGLTWDTWHCTLP